MTTTLSEALLEEHRTYGPRIDDLRRLADELQDERPASMAHDLDGALAFLEDELLPHAAAEDAVLYVAVAEVLGDLRATDTMRRDHAEIRHLVHELRRHREEMGSGVFPVAAREIRRLLYALHAIVALHVAKEEELYLPLLDDALSPGASSTLLHAMHRSVEDAEHAEAADALAADGG